VADPPEWSRTSRAAKRPATSPAARVAAVAAATASAPVRAEGARRDGRDTGVVMM